MSNLLYDNLVQHLDHLIVAANTDYDEVTITIDHSNIVQVCQQLIIAPFNFNVLIDLCAVDYLHYGKYDWETTGVSSSGFARGINRVAYADNNVGLHHNRFAVVYHLLSTIDNVRLRIKIVLPDDNLTVDSVIDIWESANWYEREAFDLFGIRFNNHPDLRRILTDYNFTEHPLRKDFPVSGHTEIRYDSSSKSIVYEEVTVDNKEISPKVFRNDTRYL